MAFCTIGAKSIQKQERQELLCIIRKIICCYTSDDTEKIAVLYDCNASAHSLLAKEYNSHTGLTAEGKLYGGISSTKDYEYYFITNYKGREIKLDCQQEVNFCTEEKHRQYIIDYVDIQTRELKSQTKDISDGKLTLQYFDLFYRTIEYARKSVQKGAEAGKHLFSHDGDSEIVSGLSSGAIGFAGGVAGAATGHLADLICSLRFIHLPRISYNDNDYGCHSMLKYRECPHTHSVPSIIINTYPDIMFKLEIGMKGQSKNIVFISTKEDDEQKNDINIIKTPFSFGFYVKYADTEKSFTFDKRIEEKDLNSDEEKSGSILANAIYTLKEFFKMAVQFTQMLKNLIENTNAGDNKALEKQFLSLLYKPKDVDWFKGSLDIEPKLTGEWRYSVSDDLTKLGKYIKLELEIGCTGKLTIDLVTVADMFIDKSKKATKVVAVASSVASGGLAALPAALITFLVDYVVDWLKDKFKEGLVCDFILIGSANAKPFSLVWDTSKEMVFEGTELTVEIKPEIKLVIGFDYKTSITLFWFMKAEGEAKATAEAAASLTWKMTMNVKEQHIGVENDARINPITLNVEYSVVGSFEISGSYNDKNAGTKHKKEFGRKLPVWKTSEYKLDTKRHKWIKVIEEPQIDANGDGRDGSNW